MQDFFHRFHPFFLCVKGGQSGGHFKNLLNWPLGLIQSISYNVHLCVGGHLSVNQTTVHSGGVSRGGSVAVPVGVGDR